MINCFQLLLSIQLAPLHIGEPAASVARLPDAERGLSGAPRAMAGALLHSSTLRLNVSTFCGIGCDFSSG